MHHVYDLDICVPICAEGKYLARAEAFFELGLLNAPAREDAHGNRHARTRLSLLVGPKCRDVRFPSRPGIDVRLIQFEREDPAAKIYGYYLGRTLQDLGSARWWARVDDDTANNVGGILRTLSHLDYQKPQHFMAYCVRPVPVGERILQVLREAGCLSLCASTISHDWECSVTSQAAMLRALSHPCGRDLLYRFNTPEQYGDLGLCYAVQAAGIKAEPVPWLDCGPALDHFSAWGGPIHSIHLIAPDLEGYADYRARALALPPAL